MIYLTSEEVVRIAARILDGSAPIRDLGLIESAVARPQASAFGEDAYPTIHLKAAALVHSLVQNHPLVDGNTRLGLACLSVFYAINGGRLSATNDEAYDLIIAIARGELVDVEETARRLAILVRPEG